MIYINNFGGGKKKLYKSSNFNSSMHFFVNLKAPYPHSPSYLNFFKSSSTDVLITFNTMCVSLHEQEEYVFPC
jgi:hypothetical protein